MPAVVDPQHDYLSVSEAARRLNVAPRVISDLLYARAVSDEAAPLIGGRRLVRADCLHLVTQELRRRRKAPGTPICAHLRSPLAPTSHE